MMKLNIHTTILERLAIIKRGEPSLIASAVLQILILPILELSLIHLIHSSLRSSLNLYMYVKHTVVVVRPTIFLVLYILNLQL